MLLPQTEAYATLKNRLHTITSLGVLSLIPKMFLFLSLSSFFLVLPFFFSSFLSLFSFYFSNQKQKCPSDILSNQLLEESFLFLSFFSHFLVMRSKNALLISEFSLVINSFFLFLSSFLFLSFFSSLQNAPLIVINYYCFFSFLFFAHLSFSFLLSSFTISILIF